MSAHDVEAKPAYAQQPRTHGEPGNGRRRRADRTATIITSDAGAELANRCKCRPAAEGVHDDRPGEVLEGRAENGCEQTVLESKVLVPEDPLDQRVGETDHECRCRALRRKARALRDAAGNDCRNSSRKRCEEEELHEIESLGAADRFCVTEEINAIRDCVANQEIHHRRDREIDDDFYQRVDLIFVPDGADFEKSKPAMHREYEYRAHQQEKDVRALL